MAVTGHPLTAQVACRVLEQGGNAVDAGVAAGIATNVVQVDMCNLGGIAPILVRLPGSNEVMSVAGVGRWSETATLDAYTQRHGSAMAPGCHPCVVPGALAGWLSALDSFGTWSFAEVAASAIELAYEGFVLDSTVATALDLFAWVYESWPSSKEVYCPDGRRLRAGDRLVQRDLGALLERLADAESDALGAHGVRERRTEARSAAIDAVRAEFYEGDIAAQLAQFVVDNGGFLTVEDLSSFRAEVAAAPCRRFERFGSRTVHVAPQQWSQGPALLQALSVLEHFDLAGLGHNSVRYIHVVTEALRLAFADRERYYGDAATVDLDSLLSDEHAAELAGRIRLDRVVDGLSPLRHPADGIVSTTQVTVVDSDGLSFTCAPSDPLAMGPVVPGLGVIVSGRGVQSRTEAGHPAALGPGRRPRVTPSPAVVSDADGNVWPIACPGGDVILQAILQAFLNVTVFDMTEQQAVEAPRAVSFAFPNSFYPHETRQSMVVVERRVGNEVMDGLSALGHDVREWPDFEFEAGSVGMVRQRPPSSAGGRPTLRAAADPRRAAYALGR
jgi:gamma-glutamyltranspeptidase/glutathione hydrolase